MPALDRLPSTAPPSTAAPSTGVFAHHPPLSGAALAAHGLGVHKLLCAGLLAAGTTPLAPVLLGLLSGALFDVVTVAIIWFFGRRFTRIARGCGLAVAVVAWLGVMTTAAVGSTVTVSMLRYLTDVRLTQIPLRVAVVAVLALVLFATSVRVALPPSAARVTAVVLLALALVGRVGAHSTLGMQAAALGLSRSPLVTLVLSALPDDVDGARIPWQQPTAFAPPIAAPSVNRARPPRHVVLWLAESTGARHVSPLNDDARTQNLTPTLEGLRAHALLFTEHYSPVPVSAKAIFSTLCGWYPLPEAAFESRVLPRVQCPSLVGALSAHGYRAALFHGGYFAFTDKLALLQERGFELLVDGASVPNRDRYWSNGWGVDDAAIVDAQLQWLDAVRADNPDTPTLSVVIALMPHYEYFLPPTAARPYGERTIADRHKNGVRYDDAQLGRLLDGYRARDMLDDTLVVFVGDHGEAFEEHPRNILHASFLYDENVRAPLMFVSARLFDHEQRSARQSAHPDITPTILDLLGLPVDAHTQGRSLVAPQLLAHPIPLGAYYPDTLRGVVDGNYKFVMAGHTEMLFDRARDPLERDNIAALLPDVARQLRGRTLDFATTQSAFLRALPTLGAPYQSRFFDALTVSTGPEHTACVRDRMKLLFSCSDGAVVEAKTDRSFNMEQQCIVATLGTSAVVHLQAHIDPAPRSIGLGLTDSARARGGAPVTATFHVGAQTAVLLVDDRFESTSRSQHLPTLAAGSNLVDVDVTAPAARNRSVCISVSP